MACGQAASEWSRNYGMRYRGDGERLILGTGGIFGGFGKKVKSQEFRQVFFSAAFLFKKKSGYRLPVGERCLILEELHPVLLADKLLLSYTLLFSFLGTIKKNEAVQSTIGEGSKFKNCRRLMILETQPGRNNISTYILDSSKKNVDFYSRRSYVCIAFKVRSPLP